MKGLTEYICYFTHLRRASNLGGAPHKPVLLLSVLDGVERGFITSERVYVTADLIALFKSNWSIWVRTGHTMNFALPFYHLSHEPFWSLKVKEGHAVALTGRKSIKSFQALVQSVDYAVIDRDLFFYMSHANEREILRNAITGKYFSGMEPSESSSTGYLDEIAEQILHDSAVQYQRKIGQLKESEDEETFQEEVFLRNRVFKRRVPEIYKYTCSMTGLRIMPSSGYSMIDACHIVPFCIAHDDTIGNGIALCPNLHRAFDNGLITVDEDFRIVVSDTFTEDGGNVYSIRQFDNKKIVLPSNKRFHPRRDVLRWHNDHVFEK